MLARRRFLQGLFIAPAIVSAANLMPISATLSESLILGYHVYDPDSNLVVWKSRTEILASKRYLPYLAPKPEELFNEQVDAQLAVLPLGPNLDSKEWLRRREAQIRHQARMTEAQRDEWQKTNGLWVRLT